MASDLTPEETHMMDQIRADATRSLDELLGIVKETVEAVKAAPDYDGDETRNWVGIATVIDGQYTKRAAAGIAAEAIMRLLTHHGD